MDTLAPITHVLPVATIQRERRLPVSGRVLVRKGQKVNTTDVVAEARMAPEHIILDVERGLGLPADKLDRYIRCKAGMDVQEGDILAGPVGIGQRVIRATRPGKIVVIGSGQILLEVESKSVELLAGYSGIVSELIPDYGVIIETQGALVQGAWGNGKIDYGLLNIQMRTPQDVLTSDRLDISIRGSVVLGGYCEDAAVLTLAAELPLRGIILSSMPATLIPTAMKIRCPLILTEGFGRMPMNSVAYKLLATSDRRETALIAEPWNRLINTRPEISIPLSTAGTPAAAADTDIFKTGQQVRVIRAPYAAAVGTLVTIGQELATLPNGLHSTSAVVRLENGETVVLPLVNLEVLE
jgi:hypothetical protein